MLVVKHYHYRNNNSDLHSDGVNNANNVANDDDNGSVI